MSKFLNVRLRHMRVFLEILRKGSLVSAAGSLNVTPAAVSKSLRELEAELGVRLLERRKTGVRATAAGERFHQHATESLLSFNRAISAVEEPEQREHRLRIGALPTAAGSIVPNALKELFAPDERANVDVVTGHYENLAAALRASELDLIVGRIITRDTVGLSFEQLYEESIVAVTAPSHPLFQTDALDVTDLSKYPIIVTPVGSTVRDSVDSFFFAHGIKPTALIIETFSDGLARNFSAITEAIWFAPAGLVAQDLKRGTLAKLSIDHGSLKTIIGLTTRTNEALSGSARRFADLLRQLAHQTEGG